MEITITPIRKLYTFLELLLRIRFRMGPSKKLHKNSPVTGVAKMVAQKVNRSNVKIENAFSPNNSLGIGVVPPVPSMSSNPNDNPKKMFRLESNR